MRVPIRKGPTRPQVTVDPYLTEAKFRSLSIKLEAMKKSHPILAAEVKRLAEMGDFSENAGYQLAKGRLRGLNQRIMDLDKQLKEAEIIQPDPQMSAVQIGSRVSLLKAGKMLNYVILGSNESDPAGGSISYLSPLGAALMGSQVGDTVYLNLEGKVVIYKIISLELS